MDHRRRLRRSAIVSFALLGIASTAACRPPPRPQELSVVFVVLDAAGARYFGAYGNALPATPRIDDFAEDATVFERAYAQAAWTLPSVGSFMTGRYPPAPPDDRRVLESETLAQVLQREGLRTAAFSENPYVTRTFGFEKGFDEFREYFPHEAHVRAARRSVRPDSQRTVDEALAWTQEQRGGRVFLYVHFLMPHAPYDPPPPFGGRFDPDYAGSVHGVPETLTQINEGTLAIGPRDLEHLRLQYQENLAWADHQTGRLLDGLDALGVLERALVIVAADHGEAFREHGELLHNTTVYEEMIHVPLVLRLPSRDDAPARFGGVVELRSLFATICEALALASCPASLAPSLFERMRDGGAGERTGLARSWAHGKKGTFAALVLARHKLIVQAHSFTPVALYDLASDPGETTDLSAAQPELVREARSWLRDPSLEVFVGEEAVVDAATRERLRALGYAE
jgi:arylsulfatase A-like enzyme